MAKIIENMTGSDIVLADIGITVPASGTYGLTSKPIDLIASSGDLIVQLSSGALKLQKSTSPTIYYEAQQAIKLLTLIPFTPALDSAGNQLINTPGLDHIDGRVSFHQSSRPTGTITYFTGKGDDPNNPSNVGGGVPFHISHIVGGGDGVVYADFNIAENKTYIHEAYLMYKNCEFDLVTAEIVPKITTFTSGVNTNFLNYNGYLILPSSGAGNATLATTDMRPVYMPIDQAGNRATAYWNATYNATTHQFENITAAPLGDGAYNLFSSEVTLQCFLNSIPLLGSSSSPFRLQTSDSHELGEGMRLKVSGTTNGSVADHAWEFSFLLTLHRIRTV